MTIVPRSLLGRLALVLALALMAGQAISVALLVRAQDRFAAERAAYIALFPIAEALSEGRAVPPRLQGRRGRGLRRRVEVAGSPPEGARLPRLEAAASGVLAQRGVDALDVRVVRTAARGRRGTGDGLLLAVQAEDGRWWSARAPVPDRRRARWGPLAAQTALIYAVLLVPVLWIGRQVVRPLARLTEEVRAYRFGDPPCAVPGGAPEDVAALARGVAAMQARVADAARERDAMLGAIGHDLRTPLTSLRLRAEQVGDDGVRAKLIATLSRTEALLEDTLALARAGRPVGEAVPTDLAELSAAAAAAARAAGRRVALGPLEPVTAPVHADALSRALGNLIDNADRHAGGGTLGVRRDGGEAVLSVTDDGPGLPDGFSPGAFSRGEHSRNRATGGTGLGLAIAQRIAEVHGGRLDVVPKPGGGTVASIRLPRSRPGRSGAGDRA